MKKLSFLAPVLLSLLIADVSYAASTSDRLSKLEEQLSIMEKEIYNKDDTPSSNAAKEAKASTRAMFEVRISTLEEQLRVLTGKLEESEFSSHRLNEELDKVNKELTEKLSEIKEFTTKKEEELLAVSKKIEEERKAIEKMKDEIKEEVKSKDPGVKIVKIEKNQGRKGTKLGINPDEIVLIMKNGKPDRPSEGNGGQYDEAFNLLKEGKYSPAAEKFLNFIKNNPKHKLVANSYYWVGESFYAQDDFEKASVYFLQGYKENTKGEKAPDSMLKLAMSLGRAGKKDESCTTFSKLSMEFPDMPSAIKQRMEKESNLFSCQ